MLSTFFKAIAIAALTVLPASASDLGDPKGEIILTVSGSIEIESGETFKQFDLEMLEALDSRTIETTTIWTEGTQIFQGVSLDVLATELGITNTTLRATAINDYAVEIPLTDAVEGGAMIAYRLNGTAMSVREKGPLWIVYPYDADADFRTEVIYSRSIWQLDRIEALD